MANNYKTLADYGKPTINGLDAGMVFAATAMKNIYQAEIEKGGRGCTQEYSSDTTGAQIRVVRPLPLPIDARELGASINGGNFSAFRHEPKSNAYGLDIITVIDDVVDIPDVSIDMIPVNIAQMYIQNISDKVVLNANAIKIAARAYTCFSAEQVDETSVNVVKLANGDDILAKVVETNGKLNKGDAKNGVSSFPTRDRMGLISSDYYASLLTTKGVLSLGGANYAYDILRKGGIDNQAETPELLDDGYVGTIVGIPFHFVSDLVIETACRYLGFPSNTFDSVVAHIASAHGNLYGLATGSSIETIRCPIGQGVRLLPKYRMGAACILPKSVSWLVKGETFKSPYELKTIFTSDVVWSYKAPGSRNVLKATLTAGATTGKFTAKVQAFNKATETWLNFTPVAGAWVVGEAHSIEEFVSLYEASNAVKGKLTGAQFGVEQTLANVAKDDYVSLLVIDGDGTVADLVIAQSK